MQQHELVDGIELTRFSKFMLIHVVLLKAFFLLRKSRVPRRICNTVSNLQTTRIQFGPERGTEASMKKNPTLMPRTVEASNNTKAVAP